jgi:hypothetical protein
MLTAAACLLGTTAATPAAVTTYPYANGFESDTVGQIPGGDWTKTGTGTALVSNNTIVAAGTNSVCINDAALTLNVDSSANDKVVRVQLFCKPVAYDVSSGDPTLAAGARMGFFVTTNGNMRVWDQGAGWSNLVAVVPTNQWLGFMVTVDYNSPGLWDLYYTNGTNVAGSGFTKLNGSPLHMAAGAGNTELTNVTVSSGSSAYVDQYVVDRSFSQLVEGSPSRSNMQYVATLTLQPSMLSRSITRYFDSTSDGLDQELGAALARALSGDANAKLHVYFPSQGGMSVYQVVAGVWQRTQGSGPDPVNVHLTRTTGFWIETTLSGVVTVDALAPPNVSPPSDVALSGSWNMLAWPYNTRSVNAPEGIGFPTTGRLFVHRPGQSWLNLRYKAGVGWTSGQGTTPSTQTLEKEQSVWFLGAGTWDIDTRGP